MDLLELARNIAPAYAARGRVGALLVAGSVARGRADAYSDLELDVYWTAAPSDADRLGAIDALGAQLVDLWPYEPDDGEWSETYRLHGHEVCISGFTVDWMTRCVDAVVQDADPDLGKQMRLAALNDGIVLLGQRIVDDWRRTSTQYPHASRGGRCEPVPRTRTTWELAPARGIGRSG